MFLLLFYPFSCFSCRLSLLLEHLPDVLSILVKLCAELLRINNTLRIFWHFIQKLDALALVFHCIFQSLCARWSRKVYPLVAALVCPMSILETLLAIRLWFLHSNSTVLFCEKKKSNPSFFFFQDCEALSICFKIFENNDNNQESNNSTQAP